MAASICESKMSKMDDLLKGNAPVYAILTVLASGGGINFLSEGAEEVERANESQARQEADYIQDTKHDALLALVNEMRIEVALLKQGQEQ